MSRRCLPAAVALALVALPVLGWSAETGFVESFLFRFETLAAASTSRLTLLALIAAATLVSEDLACIGAGLLAAEAVITPMGAVVASALGIYGGDVLLYGAGYFVGLSALHRAPLKWFLTDKTVRQGRALFDRHGVIIIVTSRFLPGTRTATFFAAGLVRTEPIRLLLVFAFAVILWTPLLVLGAMLIGRRMVEYVSVYDASALWLFVGLLGLLFSLTRLAVSLGTWRGRRLLVSRWRRLSRWEFWPFYITNVVTVLYVLYLGVVRYRLPTLFTVVNPAIAPDSGFIGESKSAILEGLDADAVGRWRKVPGATPVGRRGEILARFLAEHTLDYPIVLKPDRGQRGAGVAVCADRAEAESWLAAAEDDFIIMEFLPGEEYGVFYYRCPGAPAGALFGITGKRLLAVTGDGRHTLEELILLDDRAVCMAPTFLASFGEELLSVVPAGEKVPLVRVGTHSRGALFLDASDLASPELLRAVERIVEPFAGFYFGRFDIKVKNGDALRAGKDLKVIELNGVTSEATHIYDPAHSVFYAWQTLMEQWSIAFRIAEINRRSGRQPMSLGGFLRHWFMAGRRGKADRS